MRTSTVDPASLGLATVSLDDLRGGDAATNAGLARKVLEGLQGPHRDIVLVNAAAGLVAAGAAPDLAAGVEKARASIDTGAAAGVLDRLVRISQEAAATAAP
jgi:anthranilate phosphoribosyltransferase